MTNALPPITIDVAGLGLIFYSPFAAVEIREGENYFQRCFSDPAFVERQAVAGRMVGVATGTPGRFHLRPLPGYPTQDQIDSYPYRLRLAVEVRAGGLCVRDLYDLMDWTAACPAAQVIDLASGFYHITLLSRDPPSGVLGDHQEIQVFYKPLPQLPAMRYSGVPTLC